MSIDMDKIMEKGAAVADAARSTAMNLAQKGKRQVDLANAQSKLSRAERQLGALVYSLAKDGEENQPLVEKYIDVIRKVEEEIEALKAEEPTEAEVQPDVEQPAGKVCPQCGAEVDADALFCNSCGAQL